MKYIIGLIIAISFSLFSMEAQKAEVVYGKMIFTSSNGSYPLTSAKVYLCSKTDTLMGFTDNEGNIAFYNIKINNYVLKAVLNSDTLTIIDQNNKLIKHLPIKVTSGNNNLGKIKVKKKE